MSSNAFCQSGWFWQNPLPQGNQISDNFRFNDLEFILVGDYGTILYTSNGGLNWTIQNSGTDISLLATHFINNFTGWAVGWNGTILKTTDKGNHWTSMSTPQLFKYRDVYFFDENTGIVCGEFNGLEELPMVELTGFILLFNLQLVYFQCIF